MNHNSPATYDYYDDSEVSDEKRSSKKNSGKKSNQDLGKECTQAMTNFFEHDDFRKCRKLGSWMRRANGLVGQITTMMFLCMNDKDGQVSLNIIFNLQSNLSKRFNIQSNIFFC